jgi:Tfp pilus assembly protein PilN
LLVFCSLTAIVWILVAARSTSAQAAAVQRNVDRLNSEKKQIEVQKTALKEAFKPEELLKLNSAQSLVDRKRFSWTRLLGDLEKSLPSNVRVTRITVREVKTGGGRTTALLELTVIGKNPDDVTNMISEMDRARIFQAEPVAQTLQKGRGETGTEWVLHVQYEQRGVSPTSADHNQTIAADMTAATRESEVRR